jgi:hypothetical protein
VDAMLCCVPAGSQESQALRSGSMRVRLGVVAVMAKVIEFYVPNRLRERRLWNPSELRGKVIEFPPTEIAGVDSEFNGATSPSCSQTMCVTARQAQPDSTPPQRVAAMPRG